MHLRLTTQPFLKNTLISSRSGEANFADIIKIEQPLKTKKKSKESQIMY